jgi:hypothetical protein
MKNCEINGVAVDSSLVGVDGHAFGRPLASIHAIPYSLEVSSDEVLARFNGYYQDFIDTESEDDGFQEELRGAFLLLRETGYLSLERMFIEQPALLSDVLRQVLPSEFMGYLFLEKDSTEGRKYILQTLTEVRITGGVVVCKGQAFINPLFVDSRRRDG